MEFGKELNDNIISIIGSDHSPHTKEEKQMSYIKALQVCQEHKPLV